MSLLYSDIYDWIDACAPFDTQAGFDNSGLLIGKRSTQVQGILFALDVTDPVITEAVSCGANLIITHHPLMFSSVKQLLEDDYEGQLITRLIRNRIGLISAHTNLDQAPGGINDTLADLCHLNDVEGEGYLRVGNLPRRISISELASEIESALHTVVRIMISDPAHRMVTRMAVSSGAGSEFWNEAQEMGAQVFLSGEIRHHHALQMAGNGMACLEAGHFATEEPGLFRFASALQRHLNEVQCPVLVSKTATGAYPSAAVP